MKALIAVMASCAALHAWAGLHWYESFDYAAGGLTNVAATWQGFSGGSGLNVVSGALEYAGYTPAGNELAFGAGALDARRGMATSTLAYASILARCDKIPAGTGYLLSFYNSSIGFIMRVFAGMGADQGFVRYGVASSGGTTVWGPDFPTGAVVKVTMKYDAASQSAALWFNNRDLNEHTPDVFYTAGNLTNPVTFFAIRQGDALDNGGSSFVLDELMVGSAWADVQQAGVPRLTITEIMSKSAATDADGDWFEVYNADTATVALTGFSFDDGHCVTGQNSFAAMTLDPGQALIVYDTGTTLQVSAFTNTWGLAPGQPLFSLTFAHGFGNGDTVYIWDAASNLVATQTYPAHSEGFSREWGRGGADLGYSVYGENGAWSNTFGDIGSPGVTVADPAGEQPTNALALLAPVSPPVQQFGVGQAIPCLLSTELTNGTLSVGYATSPIAANFTAWTPAVITGSNAPYLATASLSIATPGQYYLATRWTDGLYTYYGVTTNPLVNAVNATAEYQIIVADTSLTFPTPHVLSLGAYGWSNWPAASPAGAYPANMVFHRTPIADPGKTVEMYNNYTGAYNLTSASRMNGLEDNGFAWLNTSGVGQGYLGAAVLGLNTLDSFSNVVTWTCGLVKQGDGTPARVQNVVLQYSLAPSNTFTDVPGAAEYTSAGKETNTAETFSITLPLVCENQPQVYLRWKYYHQPVDGASGSRPQVRLDDISVSGVPEPALLGLAGLLLLARRRK